MSTADLTRTGVRAAGAWTPLDFGRELAVERTWEALEAAILAIPDRAETPNAIATLVAPSGDTLSIGIAGRGDRDDPGPDRPLASIEYNHASQDPPYLAVVGDPALNFEDGGVVVFRFGGEWTEILRRNCVPVDVMLRVAGHFVATGGLRDWIGWEQV